MQVKFSMRFDFRNPSFARTAMADRYAAALDMAQWADGLGCANIAVSEHHGSDDGYLPSPVAMLAAMGARTRNVRFTVGALIAPFHDPLRIAEDFCVLDNLTRGRVDVIVAGGYVHEEFDMFGITMKERPKRVTEVVTTMKAAFVGGPFEYRGRIIRITPPPFRPGGPRVLMGGSSEPAARRAARIADGFIPSLPHVWEPYRDEVQRLGRPDPGPCPVGETQVTALAHDPAKGWKQMAPYFHYETNAYGVWREQDDLGGPLSFRPERRRASRDWPLSCAESRTADRSAQTDEGTACRLSSILRWHAHRSGVGEPAPVRARGIERF